MGLFSFIKGVGEKIFHKNKPVEEQTEEDKALNAQALLDHVMKLGLPIENAKIIVAGDNVTIRGDVATQEIREKIILAVGNVEGVGSVEDTINVAETAEEATFVTVERGDTLSKIAKEQYGNANAYMKIFEANKPMLSDPDKIYPGQVLRIPK